MHSAEPESSHFVSDLSQPEDQEPWRAVVASRVNSYRAKRKIGDDTPTLDFGPAGEPLSQPVESYTVQGRAIREGEGSTRAPHGTFDTNYYRRLNAESLHTGSYSQGSNALVAAATLPDEPCEELSPEDQSADLDMLAEAEAPSEELLPDLELHPAVPEDSALDRYCITEPEPAIEPDPEPEPERVAAPPSQGNLIVFRRPVIEPPLAPQPSRDELAEPMHNRPRILEVPEDIIPPVQQSLFPEIRLDSEETESSAPREPEIEVPLSVADISDRMTAAAMDLGVVAAAALLFSTIAWVALPEVPHTKPFFMVLGAVSVGFWAIYQHLFLLYAGRTFGMSVRGIRLSTFDGRTPEWSERKRRARFIFISMASVMLGFIWAMVDEDMLCWHDRVSRTFPTVG
jgi:uncharacterized RDD family membrane protein YckC